MYIIMNTTRRISNIELQRMKDLQALLEEKGINLNQIQLGELISEYLIENYNEFVARVVEKQKKASEKNDTLQRLLFEPSSEGIESDSVQEHDVII